MIITEDVATMVSPGPYQPATGDYTINILPFFAGRQLRADAMARPGRRTRRATPSSRS